MTALLNSIIATLIVSLISFIGIFFLAISNKKLDKILLLLVGLSAGALFGGAMVHLIPEAMQESNPTLVSFFVILGFSLFFIIERLLHWHHCHQHVGHCKIHVVSYMNLIGDAVHNFIDGLLIASSFYVNVHLGIATTIAVIAHEIPQEIADFGVLVYGNFSKKKALLMNFLSGLTAVLGALVGFALFTSIDKLSLILIPIAAGGFIYVSASDLIPELHKEPKLHKSFQSFLFFIMGVALMFLTKFIFQ